ncbi:zinc ABC transporter solute-binding protein [Hassallia byssoidea VB512170]|uniref:Zinc ABC transporter solute-binding protein n=1 Tax=Hassallia byssoidea VB512170 TaxID=1304833 RepID=A0A846H4V1_9CYAN|nr:zinc ABC transporter substrate-binding protein [Hassalia byssoidea]NEU72133.1 zinc ABC transporter solute-binding protein [Hassalia byssoidea VB512170]
MSKTIPSTNSLRIAFLVLAIGLVGCNQNTNTAFTQTNSRNNNLPQVVATTSILCDLTRQVAGNSVNLTCLIPPGADPHVYQPKQEDREAMQTAVLILYNGYSLEPSLIRLIKASKNQTPKIAVGQVAVPKPQQFQQGKKVNDPHVWHNVKNAIAMVDVISRNLEKVSPENATLYTRNSQQIKSELTQLDSWVKSTITTIPANQRELVTIHNAMGYYASSYGLSLKGTLSGISTEGKPTDARVKSLVNNIKQARVPTIFAETTINPNLIESVARQARVKVSQRELFTDSLGEPGSEGETYQKMMTANTRTIVEGLGGTYLIFVPKAR